ncbi:MAG: ferrochelatase [Proteobacteria bacterium]|nr:ferrochelatase [Pseudomonadota bacterium]
MSKTAVVLFNLGGPDSPKAVKPFLMNLFNDRAILSLPQPFRYMLASLITAMRHGKAQGIYKHMGGKSPILPLTSEQATALEQQLNSQKKNPAEEFKTFVCMRYWHPMTDVVVKKVKAFAPDRVVLLPLYPQFSVTTTGSSLAEWKKQCDAQDFSVPTSAVGCYPTDKHFIAAHVKLIKEMYWKASENGKPRVLFSAHGLPQKVIDGGDPYQWQVEKTVENLVQVLAIDELEYAICYQSKVGKLEWIGPSTEDEIKRAGADHVPVLIVPVAFVSEHSETLVELDIQFRQLAEQSGVEGYYRVQALNSEPFFIDALAELVRSAAPGGAEGDIQVRAAGGQRICPAVYGKCLCNG